MRGWQLAFTISVVVLLATNAFWAFTVIDQGVTLMYSDMTQRTQARAIQDLGALIVKGADSYTKKDILFLLRQARPDAFIVDNGDAVSYEGITFRFASDKLVEVGD